MFNKIKSNLSDSVLNEINPELIKLAEQFDTSPKNKNNKRKCVKSGDTFICEDVYEY